MAVERGTVKWFDEQKSYGFITPDIGKKDIFFHRDDIDTLDRMVEQGDRVEYEPGQGPKGLEAKNVRPFEPTE
jgi:CspA family cold shock protein